MRLLAAIVIWISLAVAPALAQSFEELVARLPEGSFSDRAEAVSALAASGDPRAAAVLRVLGDGELQQRKEDGALVRVTGRGAAATAFDLYTGAEIGPVAARSTEAVKVNNSLRRTIRAALATLTLRDPDPARRTSAALEAFKNPDPEALPALEAALAAETDAGVKSLLEEARAASVLASDVPGLGEAAKAAVAEVERTQAMWAQAQNLWFGLSLGSVLLLAAVGLAITFGVMGVINMAHGELIMIGAYTTFMVQELIRAHAPGLFDWSLVIAAPAAFLVAGAIGVGIERGIVRYLYGRPLETLLATWGVSLILQQLVRSIFGPSNREVGNPSWMSGAFQFGEMTITFNRMWIIVFGVVVFLGLLLLLKRTLFGLQMRAVTQNRAMAAEMGIRTARVDALTFGLGAGIAGLAGVALSQIDNVSPNLGQTYIIDSFLVVVFGGAGNLWGTFAAAFSLGIANKFLEPWAGAVLGKILILVFIILFIQKKPRGLFPQRGRAVEA